MIVGILIGIAIGSLASVVYFSYTGSTLIWVK